MIWGYHYFRKHPYRWRTFTLTLVCSLVQACRESADAQAAENVILKMRDAGIERLGFLRRVSNKPQKTA